MAFTLDAVQAGTASGISITVGASAKLAVATFAKRSVNDPSSVQLGGVAMTRRTEYVNGTSLGAEIWYLINPPTGTVSLTYTLTGNHRATISSYTIAAGKVVVYNTENGGSGTGTGPSAAVTPTVQPNLIVSTCVHEGSNVMTAKGTGQVGLEPSAGDGFFDEGVWNTAHTYEPTTSTSSDTQSFTNGASDTWAMAVAVFIEQTITDQTIQGKARIQKTVDQTIQGRARVQKTVDQTVQGKARIQKVVDSTIQGKARVQKTVDATITGKASIATGATTVDQTIQGRARIRKTVDQTVQGRSRIQKVVDPTIQGRGRVQKTVDSTIQGKARVQKKVDSTVQGRARIQKITDSVIQGKGRIQKATDQTIQGRAKIVYTVVDRTIQGRARVTGKVDSLIQGRARIHKTTTRTITGKAKISTELLFTRRGSKFLYTSANWGTAFYFEIVMRAVTGTVHAKLWNITDNVEVTGSTLTTALTSFQRLRSGTVVFQDSKEYECRLAAEGTGEALSAKIIVVH